jgi:polynucleotide 5'-hydroxyl-kinase GRC3/NOL9
MESGFKTAIVDADVGQKDIGPPAAITLGYPDLFLDSVSIKPAAFYFVGSVSPAGHFLPMVVGAGLMVEAAASSFVIINTTGLIRGPGTVLKSYKIEAVRPDVIIGIGRRRDLSFMMRGCRNYNTIRISSSPKAASKTPEDRRVLRERAFRRYFEPSTEVTIEIDKAVFQRSLLFTGEPMKSHDLIHCERTSEGVLAVSEMPDQHREGMRIITAGFERNLICGLADRRNRCQGLGIIKEIDFSERTITLRTPVPAREVRVIQFGDFYLGLDGAELGRKAPGSF